MDLVKLRKFETLGPFEIKDELIKLARKTSRTTQSAFLNAGRGNPNWIATTPREGFFLLGQFAITESKRVMEHPAGVGGMPQAQGIASRFEAWLIKHADMPGAPFLSAMVPFAIKKFSFEPDAFVHELVDSIIGDNYPVPDRMLVHNERIVHEYLMWAMCGEPRPAGKFDIYAVEGGTAAMCYIFKSLKANRLLRPGDTIALGTPIFTPYIELPHLEDYGLKFITIQAPQENRFQFTDAELKKLEDPNVKAFFLVNPGNPTGVAMSKEVIAKIANLVKTKRPDLMHPDRRRLRNVCPRLPFLAWRAAAQHHRRLLVLKVCRLHGMAARHNLGPRRQHLRQDDCETPGCRSEGARQTVWHAGSRTAQGQVHRPHSGRQPGRRPQPHGWPLACLSRS